MGNERIVWGMELSPPVRAVILTMRALHLEFELKELNPFLGEHTRPEFLRKNPHHTIPVLEEEGGRCVSDSHAICAYLVGKYAPSDELYPKDLYRRAVVDARMHYENTKLFSGCLKQCLVPIIRGEMTRPQFEASLLVVHEAYDVLEQILGADEWVAGPAMTIADFSCVATVSSLAQVAPITADKWPRLVDWMRRLSQLPYYEEANGAGSRLLHDMVKDHLEQIKSDSSK